MDSLQRLINQKVLAEIIYDENDVEFVEGIVTNVTVNDFYFYEKDEPIYITVSINPTLELSEDFDYESLNDIPLDRIRKA